MWTLKRLDVAVLIISLFRVLPCFGQDYETYMTRGNASLKKGQFDKAISDCTKAIEINPNYAEAYSNRGFAYNLTDQYDKAISDCNRAIEINPGDATAYNNRGLAEFSKQNVVKACSDWKRACELGSCRIYELMKKKGFCK